tara:strand:- start:1449 stop:1670 length:222 start_codon:yes stop_codon:yes gene_type:complete
VGEVILPQFKSLLNLEIMPGHTEEKRMMKKMMGTRMYGDGGMHHNPHGFGVEGKGGKKSNFVSPPKGNSKETK